MKQVLQNLQTGKTELVEVPNPAFSKGKVLIHSKASLISTGTERMLVDFGKSSLLAKARNQPEKVKQVLNKIKTDGLLTTLDAVLSKLGQPIPLGYCNVGVVSQSGVSEFKEGQRVVSNGSHAEVVNIPGNLCAKIPDNVSDEEAAFTVVASIGLQGIRLSQPTIGESFVVIGAGLIGLLTIQLLRAQGCKVLAIDLDESKLRLAREFGADSCNPAKGEDPIEAGNSFSRSRGVDGVIITASTSSSEPVSQAARMCRKRGRIVLVGVTGLELNRSEFYEKELSFQVSCSYGPGRYDENYEEKGQDYPIGYVRWTEKRNFEAILDLFAAGSLNVAPLINHRVLFDDASRAYGLLSEEKETLAIILEYKNLTESLGGETLSLRENVQNLSSLKKFDNPVVGFIGAGNYASRMLIPAFKKAGARLHTISSSGGTNAAIHGRKNGFENATSDTEKLLANPEINSVAIVTRHNSHAKFVIQALNAGKHVFVEKPLALTLEELEDVQTAYLKARSCQLMVGFNRRFAPQIRTMKELLEQTNQPKCFIMVMNPGHIPADHWTQDLEIGGGRIVGEACHHIDLMRFLSGSPIVSVHAHCMEEVNSTSSAKDKVSINLGFKNGSIGTIHYFANGGNSFPKERIEVFAGGRTLQLDNFRKLRGFNWPGFRKHALWRQDKGQNACSKAFLNSIKNSGKSAIPHQEIFEVNRVAIEAAKSIL
jgi:predicted dehydrogenase/threonine dehydrogenase-like Zn-dependent dehydrogenase